MTGRLILETERLILREFTEDDALAFYELNTDQRVTRYTGDEPPHTVEEARLGILTRPMADYAKHGFGRWACVLKSLDKVIGFAGPKHLPELGEVDLGYRFRPEQWGKGLATEAARAALEYCFNPLGLEKVIGLVIPENVASVKVLEKIGMRRVGLIMYFGRETAKYEKERELG